MRVWRRSQTRRWLAGCVLGSVIWGCFPAAEVFAQTALPPANTALQFRDGAPVTFSAEEARALLEAVEELKAARVEIAALKAVVSKDAEAVVGLQKQVEALERLAATQDKMLDAVLKVQKSMDSAVSTYQQMAAASEARAQAAEKRLDEMERWRWLGPLIGLAIGAITVGIGAALAQ